MGRTKSRSPIDLFAAVEDLLGLPRHTLKMGIMDEERRTTVNLKAVHPRRGQPRLLHQHRLPRSHRRRNPHLDGGRADDPQGGYEEGRPGSRPMRIANVDVGLACGLPGRAQIGKGMWAMPDRMAEMLIDKDRRIRRPAPTPPGCRRRPRRRCTRLHYHRSTSLSGRRSCAARPRAKLADLLTIPLARQLAPRTRCSEELDNNCQGILGYVVRWVDQGIGCSKVPDIHDVGLMEDRATLRISSQHIANWLRHGIVDREQVHDDAEAHGASRRPPERRRSRSTGRWRRVSTGRPSRRRRI